MSTPASRDDSNSLTTSDRIKLYELAIQSYHTDLNLYTTRMNLFLLVESAGVGLVFTDRARYNSGIAWFGLVVACAWAAVAASSYVWIYRFRQEAVNAGLELWKPTSTSPAAARQLLAFVNVFEPGITASRGGGLHKWMSHLGSFFVRPSGLMALLPFLFGVGWILILILRQ
ncbi:RipA family octameric membrane protein [Nakamurella endophytica]|uniref:Uncharacterized protein n=1 Tax=Nakamurella endophytica TaxID=1748367 RepID=A0A917TAE5_9ACTN|nr:hypothetical protein [Nakamurella endophytica]GGM16251.1 hypothetical protein GCM10011594_40370 [Nakamurella endophytica]